MKSYGLRLQSFQIEIHIEKFEENAKCSLPYLYVLSVFHFQQPCVLCLRRPRPYQLASAASLLPIFSVICVNFQLFFFANSVFAVTVSPSEPDQYFPSAHSLSILQFIYAYSPIAPISSLFPLTFVVFTAIRQTPKSFPLYKQSPIGQSILSASHMQSLSEFINFHPFSAFLQMSFHSA